MKKILHHFIGDGKVRLVFSDGTCIDRIIPASKTAFEVLNQLRSEVDAENGQVKIDPNEIERQRVIGISEQRGEFVTDVDGYVYWWPDGHEHGHLAACHLRWLADELDRRNEAWHKQTNEYFDQVESKPS